MTDEKNNDVENSTEDNVESFADAQDALDKAENEEQTATPVDENTELREKNAQLQDQLLRAMAEMENIRKRSVREREDATKYGVSNLAKELLAVADNLMRAVDAVPAELSQESDAIANLVTGVKATQDQLTAAMLKTGISQIDAKPGTPFDPNLHEVMFEVETPEHAPGAIVQVIETGYTIHDRLLRPARVGVAKKTVGGGEPSINVEA